MSNIDTARTLAETGQHPTLDQLIEMVPDLRRRDYSEILFEIRRLTHPANRRERRAKAARERIAERRWERVVARMLPDYERLLETLTENERKNYDKRLRGSHPHPESRLHATELDSAGVKDCKRSVFEMQILFRAHNRRVRAMQRALPVAKDENVGQ